jgi:hypothetical protein
VHCAHHEQPHITQCVAHLASFLGGGGSTLRISPALLFIPSSCCVLKHAVTAFASVLFRKSESGGGGCNDVVLCWCCVTV